MIRYFAAARANIFCSFICIFCAFYSVSRAQALQVAPNNTWYSNNPFAIPFPAKKDLTIEDFAHVQNLLREVSLDPVLGHMYSGHQDGELATYLDFCLRCKQGLNQELINLDKNLHPKRQCTQIGLGGDRCVVCCTPFTIAGRDNGTRAKLAESIADALSSTGFNGHFLSFTGGFPNPTGEEIRYAGIPYSFKIFMMLEAYKLGFSKVIWIDSACLPLNDPTPLFDYLETNEAVLYSYPGSNYLAKYLFKETHQLLFQLTGTDVLNSSYIVTIVFGLKMNAERVQNLMRDYYSLAECGYPFLSCFPEEFVLSAIIGQPDFKSWGPYPEMFKLFTRNFEGTPDTPEMLEHAKRWGCYFYQRHHHYNL